VDKKSLLSAFLTAILIGLVLASAMRFGTASTDVSGIPKPSVPEFTVKLVNNWYDVPTTYSIDPYTGETVTHPGHRVDNKTVELSIKNQPFAHLVNGVTYKLYYNVRTKPHFAEDWTELYPMFDRPNSPYDWDNKSWSYSKYISNTSPPESDSDFTVLSLSAEYPHDAQVDFQIEAIVGHDSQAWVIEHPLAPEYGGYYEPAIAYYTTSGWSNTQTLTIGESQTPTPSPKAMPTPTPAPTLIPVPGQSAFSVESNSTVSELFFNSTSSELSFAVNGTSGTAGYVKVTIAKSLLPSVQNVKVYLDGKQLEVAITEDEDSWLLSFTYMHSTHQVRISLAKNVATTTFLGIENWIWVGVLIIIVVIGAGMLVYFKKRKH
jgi:hypothetical protein